MKISLHSVSYSGFFYRGDPLSIEDMIRKLSEIGYDGLELMAKRPHANPMDLDGKARKEIRELADSHNIELANLAAYNDFSGPDSFKRELNLLYIHEVIKMARDLGIKTVRVFAAGMGAVDQNVSYWKHWELCREGLIEAAKWAEDYGVTLALQNHPPVMDSFKDVLDMIDEVGRESLKACIDPELLVRSGDINSFSERLYDDLLEIYSKFKDLLVFIHVGDSAIKSKRAVWLPGGGGVLTAQKVEREVLGKGTFGKIAESFVKVLKQIGYDGFLSYEICSPRYVKHTLVSFETVDTEVRDGLKYLKQLVSKV